MSLKPFKPMLSYTVNATEKLVFPQTISLKMDGIRCISKGGQLLSRSLKPIPNKHCQTLFTGQDLEGLDGELIVGELNDPLVYNKTNSGVMSVEGEPDVHFYVFDALPLYEGEPFNERFERVKLAAQTLPRVKVVDQVTIHNEEELLEYEQAALAEGHEGVMVRNPNGIYKYGRSTEKGGELGKLKRFEDSEALIIGYECLYKNGNEATTNALGNTERSSHKENLIPQDTLGKLIVKDVKTEVEFSIGSGFTAEQRKILWQDKDTLCGQFVRYTFFPVGVKVAPRFPVAQSLRNPLDMSE